MDRRDFLGGTGAVLAASSLPASTALAHPKASDNEPPIFDFEDAAENVTGIVKIQGDLSGKPKVWWEHGHIFGLQEGEMARPMLRYQSSRIGRHLRKDDGSYLFRYRGMTFYQDYETGEFIEQFANPYTGKTVEVQHYRTSIGEYSYTPNGMVATKAFVGRMGKENGGPYILPWTRVGNQVWVMLDERVEYQRPNDGVWRRDNALFRYQTFWDQLNDPSRSSVDASLNFQAHVDWFTWLDMAGAQGGMMRGGDGHKFSSVDELPMRFVEFAESKFPGILLNPISDRINP